MTRLAKDRELEVAIYATRTTDADAATRFGMVRRTVSRIRSRWEGTPELHVAMVRVAANLADEYSDLEARAIVRARQALDDPKTPPRDVARLLEVSAQNRALVTGAATSRTESTVSVVDSMTSDEREKLAAFLDAIEAASDDELREWAANGGISMLRDAERVAKQLEPGEDDAR